MSDLKCCGKTPVFDPNVVGQTVGDLWRQGWDMCPKCGKGYLSSQGKVCEAPTWTITKGGRSVELGTGRIRFGILKLETSEKLDVQSLMARIARLPDLEREVLRLTALLEERESAPTEPAAPEAAPDRVTCHCEDGSCMLCDDHGMRPPASLHERLAVALGWTVESTRSFSLPSLRELVRPLSEKLTDEITRAIREGSMIT